MAVNDTDLHRDIVKIVTWSVLLPILAFWPFISAFPAFTLFAGVNSAWMITIHVALFLTGFWVVGSLAVVLWLCRADTRPTGVAYKRKQKGVLLGSYATVWTLLYLIVALVDR